MSAVQVKSQCFFNEVLLNKLTADEVVVNCLNCCLFCQLSQVFIIQTEFQLYGLFFLHFMQAGNGKTNATPGNISNVDNPTLCSWRVNHAIEPAQAYLFAVVMSKVKLYRECCATCTTNFNGVFFVKIRRRRDLFRCFADRTNNSCRVVGADKSLNLIHVT